jgi:hypothetical protein
LQRDEARLLSGAEQGFAIFHIIFSPIEAIYPLWLTHRATRDASQSDTETYTTPTH